MRVHRLALALVLSALTVGVRAQDGPPPTPVFADAARSETIQQRRMVTGELRAVRRAEVAVQEAGIVTQLAVREGDRVESGDLVMRIDNTRLTLALDEVKSELAEARAALDETQVQVAYWTREAEVLAEASSRGAATDKELRDSRYQAALSTARRDSTLQTIERIRARVAFLEDRLEDAQVRAPFDGVVTRRLTEIGAWVDEGDAVIELLGTERHEAWLDVPQGLLPSVVTLIGSGSEIDERLIVQVKLDSTGQTYNLSGLRVVPDASRTTRTFSLVGIVDGPGESLLTGGSLVAYVPTGEQGETLTVSKDAVLRASSGAYVMAIRDGRFGPSANPTPVTVLFETADRVAIASGSIRAGDLLVTEGAERLQPGSGVQVRERPAVAGGNEQNASGSGSGSAMGGQGAASASSGGE